MPNVSIDLSHSGIEEKEIKVSLQRLMQALPSLESMQNKTYEATFGSDFSIEDGILTIKVKGNGVDVLTEK